MIDDGLDGEFKIGYDGSSNPSKVFTTIENLNQRTTYRLKVFATNKSGNGVDSDIVTCYTVATPGQPGQPELISSTSSSIEIKWAPAFDDGGSPIKNYLVEMDEVEGIDQANVEVWEQVFSGQALTVQVTSGMKAKS